MREIAAKPIGKICKIIINLVSSRAALIVLTHMHKLATLLQVGYIIIMARKCIMFLIVFYCPISKLTTPLCTLHHIISHIIQQSAGNLNLFDVFTEFYSKLLLKIHLIDRMGEG